jgi:hypothetical protein
VIASPEVIRSTQPYTEESTAPLRPAARP